MSAFAVTRVMFPGHLDYDGTADRVVAIVSRFIDASAGIASHYKSLLAPEIRRPPSRGQERWRTAPATSPHATEPAHGVARVTSRDTARAGPSARDVMSGDD